MTVASVVAAARQQRIDRERARGTRRTAFRTRGKSASLSAWTSRARPPLRGHIGQRHESRGRRERRPSHLGGDAGGLNLRLLQRVGAINPGGVCSSRSTRCGAPRGRRCATPQSDAERRVSRPLCGSAVPSVGGISRRHQDRARPDSTAAARGIARTAHSCSPA